MSVKFDKIFNNPYPEGWKNYPDSSTPINADSLQKMTNALSDLFDFLKTNEIPNKSSELNNDSDYVSDADYIHTDNNFTVEYKQMLDDVEITEPKQGDVLTYDSVNSKWINKKGGGGGGGGSADLAGLTDVELTELRDRDVLLYDQATGVWINSDVLGNLSDILDAINGDYTEDPIPEYAIDVNYDNSVSLLKANNVQAAIDELADKFKNLVEGEEVEF